MKKDSDKIELSPTIWHGIDSKYAVKVFSSPKNKKNEYWVKQFDGGERYTTMYRNTYKILTYEIYDKYLNKSEINMNNWKIIRIFDPKGKSAYNNTKAEIVDPTKEIRIKEISSVDKALKFLSEICEFNNWQMYDLSVLNRKLNEDNERISIRNEELQSLIETFTNTKLYKAMSKKAERIKLSEGKSKEMLKIFIKEQNVNAQFFNKWFNQ